MYNRPPSFRASILDRLMDDTPLVTTESMSEVQLDDDEYPEISEAMLQVLYPHYTQPLPSVTIVQMETDHRKPDLTGRCLIPRHHPVISPAVQGVPCRFRTCYEIELGPLRLQQAKLKLTQASEYLRKLGTGAAVITLELETLGGLSLESIQLDKLRFFLDGEAPLMHLLYEPPQPIVKHDKTGLRLGHNIWLATHPVQQDADQMAYMLLQ